MFFLAALLCLLGAVSAHHSYMQPEALTISSAPHTSLQPVHAYAIPVQVYTSAAAAVATTPQHHTPVHTYSTHQYFAPAQTYSTPIYQPSVNSYKSYSTSSYAPHYSMKYQAPAVKYQAPAVKYQAPAIKYQAPPFKYQTSSVQYQAPTVKYQAPAVQYHAPSVQYQAPTVKYQAPSVQYQAPAVQYQAHAVSQYSSPSYSSHYVKPVAILRQAQDDNFDGSFSYDFQAENGISSGASGYVKSIGPNEEAQVIQGQYSYTAPDGTPITTQWYADETGFHAEGAHLPVSPPVPEAIAKSLAYQGISTY